MTAHKHYLLVPSLLALCHQNTRKVKHFQKPERPIVVAINIVWHNLANSCFSFPLQVLSSSCSQNNNWKPENVIWQFKKLSRKFTLLWLAGYEELAMFDEYEATGFLESDYCLLDIRMHFPSYCNFCVLAKHGEGWNIKKSLTVFSIISILSSKNEQTKKSILFVCFEDISATGCLKNRG